MIMENTEVSMDENNMVTNKRRNLLIAARILYIVISLIVLRRIYTFFIVNIKYFDTVIWQLGIFVVFTVLFVVLLILQFPYVFLNKPGKIKSGIFMLVLAVVFIGYSVLMQIRIFMVYSNIFSDMTDLKTEIIIPLVLAILFWAILIAYSSIINAMSRTTDKLR